MRRPVEPIKVSHEKTTPHEVTEVSSHPAFGQISIHRSSGGDQTLYGSDFDHHARITIRVAASTIRRGVGRERFSSGHRGDIIELDMSEAQFATFVTSPNMGEGTPCTLRQIEGRMIPEIPKPESPTKRFGEDMLKIIEESLDRLKNLSTMIDEMGLPKGKAATLMREVEVAHSLLKGNTPYLAERFGEHMEETVEKAKMEVQGFMTGMANAAGLAALADRQGPVTLGLAAPREG